MRADRRDLEWLRLDRPAGFGVEANRLDAGIAPVKYPRIDGEAEELSADTPSLKVAGSRHSPKLSSRLVGPFCGLKRQAGDDLAICNRCEVLGAFKVIAVEYRRVLGKTRPQDCMA